MDSVATANAPPSRQRRLLAAISHTRYELLRACELRAVLSEAHRPTFPSSAGVLGRVVHKALELLARRVPSPLLERPASAEEVVELCEDAWSEAEALECREEDVQRLIQVSAPPSSWLNYHERQLSLLRLYRLASEWLSSIGATGELWPEEQLSSKDGFVHGTADLLVRGDSRAILDYKTGSVLEGGQLRQAMREQLELYAWLESEQSGVWPDYLAVIPSADPTYSWDVSERVKAAGQRIAQAMKDGLEAWNSRVGMEGLATPTATGCRYCPFKAECEAFWATAGSWPDPPWVVELEITGSRELATGGLMYLCTLMRASRELHDPAPRFLRIRDRADAPFDLVQAHDSQGYPLLVVVDGFVQRGAALDLVEWSRATVRDQP